MTLNFDLLEDAMNLSEDRRDEIFAGVVLDEIGPLIEYLYQTSKNKISLFSSTESPLIEPLNKVLNLKNILQQPLNTNFNAERVEFCRCYRNDSEYENANWFAFCQRLKDAAQKSGLREEFAKAVAGTFEEMVGNIIEHSDASDTGIVGYRYSPGEFEYLVADSGIGILQSLKKNSEYDFLIDYGQALEVALQDGQSSRGSKSGSEFGFHTLLHNIANRNSYLRFRSGDHYHMIDGTGTTLQRKTKACTFIDGFLVSVICKSGN